MNNFITASEWGDHHGRFGGGHPFLAILCIVAFGLVVAALVTWLLGRRQGPARAAAPMTVQASPTASAETILAERLARSEIDPTEYRSLLAALRGEAPATPPVSTESTTES